MIAYSEPVVFSRRSSSAYNPYTPYLVYFADAYGNEVSLRCNRNVWRAASLLESGTAVILKMRKYGVKYAPAVVVDMVPVSDVYSVCVGTLMGIPPEFSDMPSLDGVDDD